MHVQWAILPLATTCMTLQGIMLSEINPKERQLLYGVTYMWNLKTVEFIETRRRMVVGRGWGGRSGWSKGTNFQL